MYSVRITARPGARTSCGTPAGIHSARLDGSTHPPASVLMVRTPCAAQATWWSACMCRSKPASTAKSATRTAVWPDRGTR